ncbi:uncharacterized protein LOC120330189 [Styela clava]|uniref:uncharacterized protein LOC120330189 n=1 Tax=Styela clava TaxID=7725 RepID=UPI0019395ACE|nr:uncharacterized protein LOC120330189 [Styela clava]
MGVGEKLKRWIFCRKRAKDYEVDSSQSSDRKKKRNARLQRWMWLATQVLLSPFFCIGGQKRPNDDFDPIVLDFGFGDNEIWIDPMTYNNERTQDKTAAGDNVSVLSGDSLVVLFGQKKKEEKLLKKEPLDIESIKVKIIERTKSFENLPGMVFDENELVLENLKGKVTYRRPKTAPPTREAARYSPAEAFWTPLDDTGIGLRQINQELPSLQQYVEAREKKRRQRRSATAHSFPSNIKKSSMENLQIMKDVKLTLDHVLDKVSILQEVENEAKDFINMIVDRVLEIEDIKEILQSPLNSESDLFSSMSSDCDSLDITDLLCDIDEIEQKSNLQQPSDDKESGQCFVADDNQL